MSPFYYNLIKFILIIFMWILVLLLLIDLLYVPSKPTLGVEKLYVDTSGHVPIEFEYLDKIQKELPNVPFDFWIRYYQQSITENINCTQYPYLLQLDFHNTYWQTFQNGNITIQLYAAYYDQRESLILKPLVRLLAMIDRIDINEENFPETYCQLWFDYSSEPVNIKVIRYQRIYPRYWKNVQSPYFPYLITCEPFHSEEKGIPRTISLYRKRCGEKIKNNLRIHFDKPKEKKTRRRKTSKKKLKFAVCVKGLNFPYTDNSVRLIEWLELLRILGANKVFIYVYAIHENIRRVLTYYEKNDFVAITPLTLAGGFPNLPNYQHTLLSEDQTLKRLNEFIPYNDCLYRNMYKYDYIAAIDVDEVIMPTRGDLRNWQEVIEKVQEQNFDGKMEQNCTNGYAALCFFNAFFPDIHDEDKKNLDGIPYYMHMLRHIRRFKEYSDINMATKCFHNTSVVHTLHNHFPVTWLNVTCRPIVIEKNLAHLQHYREPTKDFYDTTMSMTDMKGNGKYINDENILRFKDELLQKTQQVLREIGFLRT